MRTKQKEKSMLELKNVSFLVDAEGKDKEIIRNISLTIPETGPTSTAVTESLRTATPEQASW